MEAMDDIPWVVWAIVLPLAAATLALLAGQRVGQRVALLISPGMLLIAAALAGQVWRNGPQRYPLGGWHAPLGIDLFADGLSAAMILVTAGVGSFVSAYAIEYFADRPPIDVDRETSVDAEHAAAHGREREYFWPLWLFLWAAMNALFLSADVFNLYVTFELLTLSSVALVALAGTPAAIGAAMRYLLAALLGSLAYLLGVALFYAEHGTLDIASLGVSVKPGMLSAVAITSITVGLLLKTALFPLHFWLPPAHANAPAPVSALLSALVVKASFYLLLRLWFEAFPRALVPEAGQMLGILGAAAIVWGSIQALRTPRLKLLVAHSTVAQLGYLFLLFPLAVPGAPDEWGHLAWSGGVYFAMSHACAKAALFLAAGTVLLALGHDDIERLEGVGHRLPMTFLTMGVAAVTLMGLPPSGAFLGKWLLMETAMERGQGWLAVVMTAGGLLAAGYAFRILGFAFTHVSTALVRPVPRALDWTALILALAGIVLGFMAQPALELLEIGSPLGGSPLEDAAP